MALETATPLYRAGGGVTLTSWSPDERNVLSATPSSLFRLGSFPNKILQIKVDMSGHLGQIVIAVKATN